MQARLRNHGWLYGRNRQTKLQLATICLALALFHDLSCQHLDIATAYLYCGQLQFFNLSLESWILSLYSSPPVSIPSPSRPDESPNFKIVIQATTIVSHFPPTPFLSNFRIQCISQQLCHTLDWRCSLALVQVINVHYYSVLVIMKNELPACHKRGNNE